MSSRRADRLDSRAADRGEGRRSWSAGSSGRRPRRIGVGAALRDLASAFKPLVMRRLEREIEDRVRGIPVDLNEYGYDPYGFHSDSFRSSALPSAVRRGHPGFGHECCHVANSRR